MPALVEEMAHPAAVRLFREQGIAVHEAHNNTSAQSGNEGMEVDLLVLNDTNVVARECKSTLSGDDVNEHLTRLGRLKRWLPRFADRPCHGNGDVDDNSRQRGPLCL